MNFRVTEIEIENEISNCLRRSRINKDKIYFRNATGVKGNGNLPKFRKRFHTTKEHSNNNRNKKIKIALDELRLVYIRGSLIN